MSFQTAAAPTLRERSSVAITVGDEPPSRSFLAAGSVKSDGSAVHAAVAPTPVSRSGSHVKSPVAAQHAHEKHLHPTLPTVPEPDKTHKSGWVVATSHIVTAVVGAGVLGLPNAFAWLGWPSAIVLLTLMYAVTLWTSVLLADLFELDGVRHPTYSLLTQAICDKWSSLAVVISQRSNQILITIAYTITGAASIVTMEEANFKPANCPGGDVKNCEPAVSVWQATLMFGAVQLLLSQLPNLEAIWWVSLIGAGTSVGYSVIAFALSCYVATPENQGTLLGRQISTTTGEPLSQGDKAFGVLNAIGTVLFAYNFSSVLVEIQDTLAEPPASKVSMRKSCAWGITMSYLFYASVGFAGYWALGNNVPGDVLAGFADTDVPGGVITFANSLVLLHMFSAFQMRAYERLVRKVLNLRNHPALVLVQVITWGQSFPLNDTKLGPYKKWFHESAEDQYGSIAQYYSLPWLSYRNAVWIDAEYALGWLAAKGWSTLTNDFTHPNDAGHKVILDMVVWLIQQTAVDLMVHPFSRVEAQQLRHRLPPPMHKGNHEEQAEMCLMDAELRSVVREDLSPGWAFLNEGTPEKPKTGYVSREIGATLVIQLQLAPVLREGVVLAGPDASEEDDRSVCLMLSYLKSYETMGKARVACSSGCACKETVLDAHEEQQRTSITYMHLLELLATAPNCTLALTVLPDTSSGGHKFKLSALMLNRKTALGFMWPDKPAQFVAEDVFSGEFGRAEIESNLEHAAAQGSSPPG